MTDLHAHPLPGIDDGPPDLAGSLELVRMAEALSIQTMVATPHLDYNFLVDPAAVQPAVAGLNEELGRQGIGVEILAGAEISLQRFHDFSPEDLDAVRLGLGPYLLIECPHRSGMGGFEGMVLDLRHKNESIVLAHPERSPLFQRDPALLAKLVDAGMLTQITAGSMAGAFGDTVRKFTVKLFREGLVHIVASDAHDSLRRPPHLLAGFERTSRDIPAIYDLRQWLVEDVPAAVVAGEPVPPRPDVAMPAERRSWFR